MRENSSKGNAELRSEKPSVSRRNLLVGSAGLTLGAIGLAPPIAKAQDVAAMDMTASAEVPSHTLSNRLYSINVRGGVADIAHDPTDIPPPIIRRTPEKVLVQLETVELEARLDERTSYPFWTFNGRAPAPSCGYASAILLKCACGIMRTA